jgi:peptide/nickel transport system substrate-binding protein
LAAVGVTALVVGLAASACSKNTGTPSGGASHAPDAPLVFVNDAKGPATPVAGAKSGGTVYLLTSSDFDFFDPQNDYRGDGIQFSEELVTRTLVGYRILDNGHIQVVGDLATDTGTTTDNCKTWKYTLRDNIKFEDGTPVTSTDVAYSVSRAFDPGEANGPTYIQRYLTGLDDYSSYQGPFLGADKKGGPVAPGITTPDSKTIQFALAAPHCDFPLAAALLTTAVVPKAKDTGPNKYDTSVVSSGPYEVQSYTRTEKMHLVRNPYWDPNSDPIRHAYPDEIDVNFTIDGPTSTNRIKAGTGTDVDAFTWNNVPSANLKDFQSDTAAAARVVKGDGGATFYMAINTKRVTDVAVRQALNFAYNKDAVLKLIGGDTAGTVATTIMDPSTPGYKNYNAYPAPATGDVDKAKALLQGKTVPPLKYCYRSGTQLREDWASSVKQNLERAGFQIVLTPLDRTAYYPRVSVPTTDCDLINAGWGKDYPDGSTFLSVLMKGGKSILPAGNNNLAYLDDSATTQKLIDIDGMANRTDAAAAYGNEDEAIMTNLAPWVPIYYSLNYEPYGSGLGGTMQNTAWGYSSFQNIYVK